MEQLDLLAGEFVEAVSKLKLEDGGDILVVGSRTLVHTLMEFDLVDEVGLAVLASLAAARTDTLLAAGDDALVALNGGYQAAFLVGALFAAAAAVVSATLLRPSAAPSMDAEARPEPTAVAEAT